MSKHVPPRSTSEPSPRPDASPEGGASSLASYVLRSITRLTSRRPRLTLWLTFAVSCACVGFTVLHLKFKTERADLISPDAAFHQRWLRYAENFGSTSDIVVVVEADRAATIKPALDELGERLRGESELFANVFYKFDSSRLRAKGLQYLTQEQLAYGEQRLGEFGPILSQGRWQMLELDRMFDGLHKQAQHRAASNPQEAQPAIAQAGRLAASMERYLADRNDFQSPWSEVLQIDRRMRTSPDPVMYFLNDAGTMGFLKVQPKAVAGGFDGNTKAIDALRKTIAEIAPNHPQARFSLTGIPVLENDEMRLSQQDMTLASIISFVGVAVILFVGFRGFKHPMLAMAMLAVGMAWSFGFTTLAVGHLNILSVSFAAILIGLGIDFAIHFLAKYLAVRREGEQLRPALVETSSSCGAGILTAAITTALAFFCAAFTPFLGVAELGIIAGGGILLCMAATFVVLPASVALADQHVDPQKLPRPFEWTWLRSLTSRWPRTTCLLASAVVVGVASQAATVRDGKLAPRVRYDYNLLNLQADGVESVEVQKRIFQNGNDSLLFAVSLADSAEGARILKAKFEALPSVGRVEELGSMLPPQPNEQTRIIIDAIKARLQNLPASLPRGRAVDPHSVGRTMEQLYVYLRKLPEPGALEAARAIDRFLDSFERLGMAEQATFLADYQIRFQASLLAQFQAMRTAANTQPLTLADLPPELTSRFLSKDGQWLIQIHPKEEVWDIEPLRKFVADLRTVDPHVTGTPLQNYEASRQIMTSYEQAAILAFCVICVVLLVDLLDGRHKLLVLLPPLALVVFGAMALHARRVPIEPIWLAVAYLVTATVIATFLDLRNLRDALLSLSPPVLGMLMMFGILGLIGVDLNPANLIVLPLVLGIGVDNGVHVVHDFRAQAGATYRTSASIVNAIALTSLTTMVGFGSMMIAAHRGLFSLGVVLTIGIGTSLFVSLVLLPALLTAISGRGRDANVAARAADGSGRSRAA